MKTDNEKLFKLIKLWKIINQIANDLEDSEAIRLLIKNAGIKPNMHIGQKPEDFTCLSTAEWIMGQWADMIDSKSPFLNSMRNISITQLEEVETALKEERFK